MNLNINMNLKNTPSTVTAMPATFLSSFSHHDFAVHDAFHREVAGWSTPCTDSQSRYPTPMAFLMTFIMAIGLLAAGCLDHLNGTLYACSRSILMHYLCLDSLPSAEVFEGLPTGWNFTPQIGVIWHRAHALLALFSIFDNLLISSRGTWQT